jgi:hypothetical protein
MENKQTAVEWLESELDWLTNYMMEEHKEQLFNQAKAMEKEQIKSDFHNSVVAMAIGRIVTPEQYYNETYGK